MEIVMDIETLEIFEVIDSDNQMTSSNVKETTEGCQCLDEPRRVVQLTLFDDSFYPHPVMFFEDSS
nr:hypothetical protein [Streptococcus gallolyticus]